MTIDLTVEEKIAIVEQHLKNNSYSEYNVVLSLAQAQAVANPNIDTIQALNNQLADVTAQKLVLEAELDSLQ